MDMEDLRYILVGEDSYKIAIDIEKEDNTTFFAEFELMNPFEVKDTFRAYFNYKSD